MVINEQDKIQDFLDDAYDRQKDCIQREDVLCSACGQSNWTHKEDGFLICECGHEQEDD